MAKQEESKPDEKLVDETTEEKSSKEKKKRSAAVKTSIITASIAVFILVWTIMSDRHTPHTDQARVKGLLLPIAPMVSGYVTKVNIGLHSHVKYGDTLLVIDQTQYKLAVNAAESSLEFAVQSVSSGVSTLKAATASLSRANVWFDRASKNWERTQRVVKENVGALSQADIDRSEASYLDAIEQVKTSQANLERIKQTLGPLNEDNPTIKAAMSKLEKAQNDLEHTIVIATSDGIIESFNIEPGYFASAGHPLFSIVANKVIWVQADLKENNLSNSKIGDKVEIIFDIEPGKVFEGTLSSISYGVATDPSNPGGLPQVTTSQGWLQDPQRFPVLISINDEEIKCKLKQGSQAEVVVYTGQNPILNWLARLRIRIVSILSYVR